MNRLIKFRAKGFATENKWYFGGIHISLNNTYYMIFNCSDPTKYTMVVIKPETLGQFTGLLDKNDTEIYEGDIVEISNNRYDVSWDDKLAAFTAVDTEFNEPYLLTDLNLSKTAVIGNIYDNPSLIQQTYNNGL